MGMGTSREALALRAGGPKGPALPLLAGVSATRHGVTG